jgi:hypothetical protein
VTGYRHTFVDAVDTLVKAPREWSFGFERKRYINQYEETHGTRPGAEYWDTGFVQ